MAVHDEQRVVDTHGQAQHESERGGDRGHVHYRGERERTRDTRAHTQNCLHQRQAGAHESSHHDEQDQPGNNQADRLTDTEDAVEIGGDLGGGIDLDPEVFHTVQLAEQMLTLLGFHGFGLAFELHVGHSARPVVRDELHAFGGFRLPLALSQLGAAFLELLLAFVDFHLLGFELGPALIELRLLGLQTGLLLFKRLDGALRLHVLLGLGHAGGFKLLRAVLGLLQPSFELLFAVIELLLAVSEFLLRAVELLLTVGELLLIRRELFLAFFDPLAGVGDLGLVLERVSRYKRSLVLFKAGKHRGDFLLLLVRELIPVSGRENHGAGAAAELGEDLLDFIEGVLGFGSRYREIVGELAHEQGRGTYQKADDHGPGHDECPGPPCRQLGELIELMCHISVSPRRSWNCRSLRVRRW